MKSIVLSFIVMCNSCTFCDICSNNAAVEKFSEDLSTLEYYITTPRPVLNSYPAMIRRLENVTNIMSESDHGYFGALPPTHNDIVKWRSWLETHKAYLCWDKERNEYYLMGNDKN